MHDTPKLRLDARIHELEQERDARIAELQEKIDRLKRIRDELDDSEMSRELARAFRSKKSQVSIATPASKSTQLEKVRRFFLEHRNMWANTTEIANGSAVKTHSVRQLLYSRYPELFDVRPHPSDPKRKQFRLKADL